jgi:hypothetical protein
MRRRLDRCDDLPRGNRLSVVEGEDLQGVQRIEPPEDLDLDVHHAVPAGHEVHPALPRRLEGETGAGCGSRQAPSGLVLVQVPRVEQGEAQRLRKVARARRRDQPTGRGRIQPSALSERAAGEPRRGQEHCAFEFVGGESGEVGRSEASGSHPRVSRR